MTGRIAIIATMSTAATNNAFTNDLSQRDVFENDYLLHRILMHLPMCQLFTKQRVCPRWRDLMSRSHSLQKKMYLLADGPLQHLHEPLQIPIAPNPAMQFSCNTTHEQYLPPPDPNPPSMAALNVTFNNRYNAPVWNRPQYPFRFELFIGPLLKDAPYHYDETNGRDEPHHDYVNWMTARKMEYPNASWRNMLFSQPPLVALEFTGRSTVFFPRAIYNAKGLRLGEIHDWAVKLTEMYIETGRKMTEGDPLGWFEFSMPVFPESEETELTSVLQRCYDGGEYDGRGLKCDCIRALKQIGKDEMGDQPNWNAQATITFAALVARPVHLGGRNYDRNAL